jgi:hypothetical protein
MLEFRVFLTWFHLQNHLDSTAGSSSPSDLGVATVLFILKQALQPAMIASTPFWALVNLTVDGA